MKAMILTCHTPYNYGAVLQCYALMRYLKERGLKVQVIDYRTPDNKRSTVMKVIVLAVRYIDFIKCKKVFGGFINRYLTLTKDSYETGEDLLKNCPKADIYIAGSDQIWNYELPNGQEDTFFLDFVKEGKKISYAASMGLDSLPEEQKKRYHDLLHSFYRVSVREKSAEKLLNSIGIPAVTVLDPVFLLSRKEWFEFIKPSMFKKKEPYVLVYSLCRQEELYRYARELAKKYGLKVYTISNLWSDIRFDHDRFFWNPATEQFLALIYQADHVVTNSYHGLCYSIIFKRDFHMFLHREAANLRMKDLMDTLNLNERWVYKENMRLIETGIDYKSVNQLLIREREISEEFIQDCITE